MPSLFAKGVRYQQQRVYSCTPFHITVSKIAFCSSADRLANQLRKVFKLRLTQRVEELREALTLATEAGRCESKMVRSDKLNIVRQLRYLRLKAWRQSLRATWVRSLAGWRRPVVAFLQSQCRVDIKMPTVLVTCLALWMGPFIWPAKQEHD
jgi:hypothetical protein